MTIPDNVIIKRHKTSGQWAVMNLTDQQLEKCKHALQPSYNVGRPIQTRSTEVLALQKMAVGDFRTVRDFETAHRQRIYLTRIFGTGAGATRVKSDGIYQVWRIK